MRVFSCLLVVTTAITSAVAFDIPEGASISVPWRHKGRPYFGWNLKDKWGNSVEEDRHKITIRASEDDTDDISADFVWALEQAQNGGLVHLEEGKTYVIGKKIDLPVLNDVYIKLDGTLKFTDDIEYWQKNYFYYPFQKSITFMVWSGQDIRIYGKGTMDGNGQAWYDGFAGREILDADNTYYRPILFLTDNATNVDVEGITFLNSPCWTTFLVRTKDVSFDNVYIEAFSTNASALPKNTDGFDSLNVDGLTVTNTRVNVGDDCFSPKPNTTNIYVENLWCNGTHGVSMGSIGQYPGVLDYISNAYMKNITLLNGQNGARLKAWAGPQVGYGYISNITYENIYIENTDAPIVLDQCYFNINETTCAAYPSNVNITDVKFINVTGSSSGKEGGVVADLTCSPGATCSGIMLEGIDLTSPNGTSEIVCNNIQGDIGVPCVSGADA
ncbi:glycoside hydrolase family 28 protein [Aureobasidium subglaciale EXF-2481]|uniref:galacturonan 1,4-alpha-galacturonidase n=1 Tax=Aureobasidium subglaciale (strain EXF-2481) TaxID=1043005 RepID=A0A074YFI2_AURSE|nr:glycoside hydrolase family 28 protein [Aureobasidium subglaciale EXF-2481]KAI5198363.1 glycoside hydrolase family 28 protein [Aureobasidium subglaciale]KAI5217177.1 glycoside hydrolase family 28 protein [Aureobasidium subglaciale]KAI5220474.1 glycoside hydrolase family 28 protein [Aureobasidium subglaciale]KAI5258308.1 glycoside hydrolase family 28 protein [Aureobasidium subglaciale]KEQ92852.1 glycoside hydrolase family 28 protein [Aureobasidium subglaciale EXF-2481]